VFPDRSATSRRHDRKPRPILRDGKDTRSSASVCPTIGEITMIRSMTRQALAWRKQHDQAKWTSGPVLDHLSAIGPSAAGR
jgi:hypothetical protein